MWQIDRDGREWRVEPASYEGNCHCSQPKTWQNAALQALQNWIKSHRDLMTLGRVTPDLAIWMAGRADRESSHLLKWLSLQPDRDCSLSGCLALAIVNLNWQRNVTCNS